MTTPASLAPLLERFFTDRLMQQRQASPHTVSSYRDTFRQLLKFIQQRLHHRPSNLAFEQIDAPLIVGFLDHLEKTIRPALNAGLWGICDRFSDSTRVYQSQAGGLLGAVIDVLDEMVVAPTSPDLTIILDLPAELGLGRALGRRVHATNPDTEPDAYEKRDLAFHWRLRQGFTAIALAEPQRCALIDATMEENAVFAAVWREVQTRLLVRAR